MTPAPVVWERSHWTGEMRPRCTACHKIAKSSEAHAREAARKIQESRGVAMYAYYSPKCGHWHLTRGRRGRQGEAHDRAGDHRGAALADPAAGARSRAVRS